MGVVLEEADETTFRLEIIIEGSLLPKKKVDSILAESDELVRIFAASFFTARVNNPITPKQKEQTEPTSSKPF